MEEIQEHIPKPFHKIMNKTRYVVERFFAWLKCEFQRLIIRYKRKSENYLAFLNIASFLMCCKVLR